MAQTENQKKLLKILNEIFQLDQSDLDFGIYRIMNTKSKEIQDFLENDLISNVQKAFSSNDNSSIQKELDDKVKSFREDGFTEEQIDNNTKIIALREQLSSSSTSSNLENDVFSHLANFFKRYYKDGDFVSLRRYKKDTYAIPYEGEEVKLHWANSDQYYIKSGEYFRDYTFTVNDKTIHLKLSDAQTESNNNKATSDKERRFVILENNPCEVIENELYINFEYKAIGKEKQDKLNEEAIAKALESIEDLEFITALNTLAPTEKNKNRTIFEKHLTSYTSRNSFDYFIHKDLGGFLGRELDFYIKNEMLFLDDIMESPIKYDEVMGKVKVFKEVSAKIIAFLTQLEELQKKLWEKKKFIIETNYCITLDKIDEEHYEKIFACKAQLQEWKSLFGSEALASQESYLEALKRGAKAPLPEELKYLVLDTKFFDMAFKYKLLAAFDNLDEECDGVLINSENFGALNLLQDRYKEQVKTVYIDPPYNTGSDGFLYADSYQHSSWLSLIYDRLFYAKNLMGNSSTIWTNLDDTEIHNYSMVMDNLFTSNSFVGNIAWKKTSGDNKTVFAFTHDNLIIYGKNKAQPFKAELNAKQKKQYSNFDKDKNDYFALSDYRSKWTKEQRKGLYFGIEHPITKELIFPDTYSSSDRVWSCSEETHNQNIKDGLLWWGANNESNEPKKKRYLSDSKGVNIRSVWDDCGTNDTASQELKDILNSSFSAPKPKELIQKVCSYSIKNKDIILDFFAGSGTTAHAVINLNREDNGKRKYILVEMGEYFDSITKPRTLKVIYSESWKDGKPTSTNGISQMFKYFRLESYEDTLNNLEFRRTQTQEDTLALYPKAKEEYMLNYSLDVESQGSLLNIDSFKTPFDYKLKIATSSVGETKETIVDLIETFNYLLGLVVKRIELLKGYLVVEGRNLGGEKILIIWRDGQSSDELNEFFKKMDWSVYDREFDTIYVNGDNNLDNLRKDEEHFKVKLIEQEFKRLMFNE